MHFYFSATEIECYIFCLFFRQRIQTLKAEYKYGQYSTLLSANQTADIFRVGDIYVYMYIYSLMKEYY